MMSEKERRRRQDEFCNRLRELTQDFSYLDYFVTDALEREREFVLDALAEIDR